MESPAPRRPRCPRCERPARSCLCGWTQPIDNRVPVLVLQHPLEVQHPKGSARLLTRSLSRCECWVGERFDPDQLATWIGTDGAAALLYPATQLGPTPPAAPARVDRLVLIDATWRKSLKMLLAEPQLQALPRLALQAVPPSRYRIRPARREDQRSTLEACCQALGELEACPERYDPLLQAFDDFVAAQAAWMTGRAAEEAVPGLS